MGPKKKHADHDHIHARLERYIQAYEKEDTKALLEFMDEKEFVYSQFGTGREGLRRADIERELNHSFDNFYELDIKTLSFHGHRNFTAWEWVMTYRHALDEQGNRRPKDKAGPQKLRGCTLMWWNDNDKIVKQHDYLNSRDPFEADPDADAETETEIKIVGSVAR